MTETMLWSPVDVFLWGMATILSLVAGVIYLKKSIKIDDKRQKSIIQGFSITIFCITFGIIFCFIKEITLSGMFKDFMFYGNYDITSIIYEINFKLVWIGQYGGLNLFFLFFERSFKRTKYLLTLIGFAVLLTYVLIPLTIIRAFNIDMMVYAYFGPTYTILIYLLNIWSDIEHKAISSYLFLGGAIVAWGLILTMDDIKQYNAFPLYIAPIFICIGTIITILPIIINASRSLFIWQFLTTLIIIIFIIIMLVILNTDESLFVRYVLFPSSFVAIFIFVQITNLRTQISYRKERDKRKEHISKSSMLSAFIKPQRLTEEEVTVAKEKGICLVCKSEISRANYICPECKTFYCKKCSDTLVTLENACWVCNTPFDETKPVKIAKKEEDLDIELPIKGDNK